jgi:hypothetical protein
MTSGRGRFWLALALLVALAPAAAGAAEPVECWRGWGYRVDPQTRTYLSEELLLTSKGAVAWEPGREVMLYPLDRASGRIDPGAAALVIRPGNVRSHYQNNLNYVDGEGSIDGSPDHLVFGLNHVPPPSAAIEQMIQFNRWACGLEKTVE